MEQAAFGIVDIQEFYDLEVKLVSMELNHFGTKAESFYNVNYGSSIITSKVRQIISVMKT